MNDHLRMLAVDYGSKRIGVAVSDPLGITAQPIPYIRNLKREQVLSDLKKIIEERSVGIVIVGLPRSLDGTLGPKAAQCRKLARQIEEECGVSVSLFDESFTTRDAEEILVRDLNLSRAKRKEVIDSMAACLILKYYMNDSCSPLPGRERMKGEGGK